MLPPPFPVLQGLNALMSLGYLLNLTLAMSTLSRAGWSPTAIGAVMTAANLCYSVGVIGTGQLAERFGRARMALFGAAATGGGCLVAALGGPWAAVAGACIGLSGAAMFYPANAGLFSDREGAIGSRPVALHRKVGGYNLGWSIGNLVAFTLLGLLGWMGMAGSLPHLLLVSAPLVMVLVLWHWRRLPPMPPPPVGDRSDHPALGWLTFIGRFGVLLTSMVGSALIALGEKSFTGSGLGADEARRLGSMLLMGYSCGYIAVFTGFARWDGWVMRPWRWLACQSGLLAGAVLLVLLSQGGGIPIAGVVVAGFLIGSGYGAAYTASIYYSLRLPTGASRAAGWHEMAVGLGNVVGPFLAGVVMDLWRKDVIGLGGYAIGAALCCLLIQAALIPQASRRLVPAAAQE